MTSHGLDPGLESAFSNPTANFQATNAVEVTVNQTHPPLFAETIDFMVLSMTRAILNSVMVRSNNENI